MCLCLFAILDVEKGVRAEEEEDGVPVSPKRGKKGKKKTAGRKVKKQIKGKREINLINSQKLVVT